MTNEVDSTLNNSIESEISMSSIVNKNKDAKISNKPLLKQNATYLNEEKHNHVRSGYTVKDTCRVCLSSNHQNMVSLFSTNNCQVLASMLVYVTSIKVNPKENLPMQVCKSCQKDVIRCYNFKMKCLESDGILRSLNDEKLSTEEIKSLSDIYKNSDQKIQPPVYQINLLKIKNDEEDLSIKIESVEKGDLEDIEYLEEDFLIGSDDRQMYFDQEHKVEEIHNTTGTNKEIKETGMVIANKRRARRKQLECDKCCKKFLKFRTLKLHIKQHHSGKGKKPFPCPQCKESFHSEHDRHLHGALHVTHANKWTCNKCHKEFNVKNRLRRHIRRHMEWKRHACDSCGKRFAELCSLRRHARVHTGELLEKKHHCDVCGKRFADRAQLSTHAARHTGERACACDECGKAFRSRRLLASHRRVHSDHKPHACLYCPRRFRHESTRNTHHRTHTGEKPYVCSTCGKTFIQNSNLTRHMRTHTGEKPYTCDVCGRKFSSGSTLTCHQRTHTGEKPYGCPVCGKKFARMDMLSHARQHTGERPFLCCACPKAFASAARLRDHYLIHTDEKAFECAICSVKFKKKSYLAKHLKYHEANLKSNDKELLLVQQVPLMIGENVVVSENDSKQKTLLDSTCTLPHDNYEGKYSNNVEETKEFPEVSGKYIVQDHDDDVKTELLVVDEGHNLRYHSGEICLNTENIRHPNNDVNLVTLSENEVQISAPSSLECTPVKLYQLDQSLVQIETSGGNVTIRKITSKMTANF